MDVDFSFLLIDLIMEEMEEVEKEHVDTIGRVRCMLMTRAEHGIFISIRRMTII